ncbi:MAG: 2-amino-4-hydroxy-6-hydroxymethyldihydropteridine diphosphokinase [Bacteroidota bacterium]
MKKEKLQYFIGLGSNLEPEQNMLNMVEALFTISERVDISEIIRTDPVGLKSENYFLNTVVRIETIDDQTELKNKLNIIEGNLGRDRSNPSRKYKDRTADLDILFSLQLEETYVDKTLFDKEGTYTVNPLLTLIKYLNYKANETLVKDHFSRIQLNYNGITIGKTPVRLNQQIISK